MWWRDGIRNPDDQQRNRKCFGLWRVSPHQYSLVSAVFRTGAQYKVTPANNKEDNKTHHFLLGTSLILTCVCTGNGHGNDGDRNMTKYFAGGGALYGGEITRRGSDSGQGTRWLSDRDTTWWCPLARPGETEFCQQVLTLTKRWFTIVVIMLRAHVLSIACLGRLSLPGAGFRDPGPGYFLSQKVASYHIHECCNSEVAWTILSSRHSSSWLLCRLECGDCGGMNINWAQIILCWVLMFENWTILLMPRSEWCMRCK